MKILLVAFFLAIGFIYPSKSEGRSRMQLRDKPSVSIQKRQISFVNPGDASFPVEKNTSFCYTRMISLPGNHSQSLDAGTPIFFSEYNFYFCYFPTDVQDDFGELNQLSLLLIYPKHYFW